MTVDRAALVRVGGNGTAPGRSLWLWCPGCDDAHRVVVARPDGGSRLVLDVWTWDGNEEAPTISPSIKVTGVQWDEGSDFHKPTHPVAAGKPIVCHSFVRDGRWQFLNDCTHTLAARNVPMVPLPEWLDAEYVR